MVLAGIHIHLPRSRSSSWSPNSGTCRRTSCSSVTTYFTMTPRKRRTRCISTWDISQGCAASSIGRRTSRVIAWRVWSIIFWASGSSSRPCDVTCARTTIAAPIRRISGALFRRRSTGREDRWHLPRGSTWRTLCELGRIRPASPFCASGRIAKLVRSSLRRCVQRSSTSGFPYTRWQISRSTNGISRDRYRSSSLYSLNERGRGNFCIADAINYAVLLFSRCCGGLYTYQCERHNLVISAIIILIKITSRRTLQSLHDTR